LICYIDSSALVKRYLDEPGRPAILQLVADAEAVGTAVVSRAEVVAAFSKSVRLGAVSRQDAELIRRAFQDQWQDLSRIDVSELVVERAADLAWELGLRGYDSVQLSAALTWQESLGAPLILATFDVQLWEAAAHVGMDRYPHERPGIR
jgi:uncharacterized protein